MMSSGHQPGSPRDVSPLLRRLNPLCASALEAAASLCQARLAGEITIEHWLLKLLEHGDSDIALVLRRYEIDIDTIWDALLNTIDRVPRDLRSKPALSPALGELLQGAWLFASTGDEPVIRSAHLLQALADAPHLLRAREAWPLLTLSAAQVQRLVSALDLSSAEARPSVSGEPPGQGTTTAEASGSSGTAGAAHAHASGSAGGEALARFAIDLTAKAQRGDIDPVFGRDREIQQVIDVLARRRKNNPILVGEPGVGKTALVEGLALRVAEGTVPEVIRDVRILTLDLGLLQAGAGVKGEFEQRLKNVIDEVQASDVPVLLFIDEAHTLIGAGNAAGGSDAANLLKPALARGELRTIAATTWSEYKEYFERDAALERRFQVIRVDEPDDAAACLMLRGLADRYARYHRVHIRDEAIVAAVKLSRRYIPARQLPDKAVDLIDTAAARVRIGLESPPAGVQRARAAVAALELELSTFEADRNAGIDDGTARVESLRKALVEARQERDASEARYASELELVNQLIGQRETRDTADTSAVDTATTPSTDALQAASHALAMAQGKTPLVFADVDARSVALVVAEWTGVPVGDLLDDELGRLLSLEQLLATRVVAQDDAIGALAESLRTAKAGLKNEQAPLGVFLLAGPSGVGKTETGLALADLLFGGQAALTTINMSEYQESHTVSQLKGSPPGYVGYGRGGILTEAVRQRPYSVILLDEIEKAHRDVLDIFYQVFDRGSMRDGEGREIDFSNCVILMTSNLGSEDIHELVAAEPGMAQAVLLEAIRPRLVAHFQPALLARFQTLVYRPLDVDALKSIVRMKLDKVAGRLRAQHDVELSCDDALVEALAEVCLARESGARNVDAYLNQRVLPALSRELLTRMASAGDTALPAAIRLSRSDSGDLSIDFVDGSPAAADTAAG
ncbi:MAG TPA: type VI secretion system ATPase TssH [Paraburkholderia sp.]|nr:type VI secretion system ATPase TssH [Paraburkholderia sp.]